MKIIEYEDGSYIRQWRCTCNNVIESDSGDGSDVECDCGRLFNAFGQELCSPDQWGSEY